MGYDQREQEVQRAKQALTTEWEGAPEDLRQYVAGDDEELRRDIYALYWRLGRAEEDLRKRRAYVEFMLTQTRSETPFLRGQLLKWLQDFGKDDFGPTATRLLVEMAWTPDYAPEVIRLLGVAEVKSAVPKLKAQVKDEPLPADSTFVGSNTWAALLALARMSDDDALRQVIARVRSEKDIVLRASVFFGNLGYTRRPGAFDTLRDYVGSAERLPQVKETSPGRPEACYAAGVFVRHVEGFPLDDPDVTERDLEKARSWVKAQKQWTFKQIGPPAPQAGTEGQGKDKNK